MTTLLRKPVLGIIGIMAMLAMTAAPALAQFETEYDPGTPEFQRTWDRTDKPVADGVVSRTWNWGPGRTEVMSEQYAESPNEMRQVQYFDKSRMEITDPSADDDGLWFVTNGLLVVEMVTGMMQVGDAEFESRNPADVNIVGDPGNAFSPTYADIATYDLRDMPADAEGALITRTLNEDGEAVDDASYASYGVTAAERVTVPGIDHTVAGPFWQFMNSSGPVWEDGQIVTAQLFPNPFYATGLPITGAFWATAPVAGTSVDVLWQCFERRCLTYTPSNNEGFQVEAGNVGQHYWTWRYGQQQPSNFDGTYNVELDEFNDSGVTGTAMLTLAGDQLTVEVDASGLTPAQQHLQHIHGFSDDGEMAGLLGNMESTCFDSDAYGPVLVPLEPYPTADAEGNVSYSETLTIDPAVLGDPSQRAIVMHGMDVDGEYSAGIPVACGEIEEGELPPPASFDGSYYAQLDSFNASGVAGTASLTLEGDQLTVEIAATGLTPDETHLQHIHGFSDSSEMSAPQGMMESTCLDSDAYGPVLIPLEPFPTADSEGNLNYSQTLTIDPSVLMDPAQRAIVIHGMDVDGEYNVGIPVACGEITEGELPPPANFDGNYYAQLGSFNDSGVTGTALLTLDGDQLTVQIDASGLTPAQQHLQHIHGFSDDGEMAGLLGNMESTCFDSDAYGPVLVPLEPYPTADAEGNVSYSETLTIDPAVLGDPSQRAIVMHGMDVDGEYSAGIPVACGEIQEGDGPPPPEPQTFMLHFGELNDSGVSGSGMATLIGNQLTVEINATGFEADAVHPQHIHGQDEGWSFCPGPDFDTDENGTVEIGEGVPAYGAVRQPLFVDVEAEEYPSADAQGNVTFSNTYTVDLGSIGDLGDRVVVLHGMTVDDEYVAGQPVACSLIVPYDASKYAAMDLSGANQQPEAVESDGAGSAYFWYDGEADVLYYMVNVTGVEDVTAAHIHSGGSDETGGVVLGLFATGEDESFAAFGILSSGQLTADDLSGDLAGMTLSDLTALFGVDTESSEAYVNVHSVSYPAGELRNQVTLYEDMQ